MPDIKNYLHFSDTLNFWRFGIDFYPEPEFGNNSTWCQVANSQPEITQLKVKDLQLKVNKSNNSLADTSFRSERVSA